MAGTQVAEPMPTTKNEDGGPEELQRRFEALVHAWREATLPLSDVSKKVAHPAYQEIIRLGQPAIPLILREMERRPGHWFAALRVLTGESPVPPEDAGNVRKMTEAWLVWGRERGYIS